MEIINLNNYTDEELSLGLSDAYAVTYNPVNALPNDKVDEEGGNTGTPSSKVSQCRRWSFTSHVPEGSNVLDILYKIELGLMVCTKYVFQVERCPTTDKLHIQGYCEFSNGRTLTGVKRLLPGAHLEKSVGDAFQNWVYCTKVESRYHDDMIRVKGFPRPARRPFITMRPWQEKVFKLYESEPDDRSIYWFFDSIGGTGKTAFAKHLCMLGKTLYVNGKASDVKYAVATAVKAFKEIRCVIWGIPRSSENYVNYGAMEEIKDGLFFSNKYEAEMHMFNPPHIFVFCNFYPKTSELSEDRWKIYNLGLENFEL